MQFTIDEVFTIYHIQRLQAPKNESYENVVSLSDIAKAFDSIPVPPIDADYNKQ